MKNYGMKWIRAVLAVLLILTWQGGGHAVKAACLGPDCIDNPNLATAAFVQLNLDNSGRDSQWWHDQVASMHAVGMDTVIIQYTGIDDSTSNLAFYATTQDGITPLVASDPIEYILQAADLFHCRVFLGLHLITSFDTSGSYNLDQVIQRGQQTIDELTGIYGAGGRNHASLSGWYFPQEINDYVALTPEQDQLSRDLVQYTGQLADYAHIRTGLQVLIAPFFGQNPDGTVYANWWDTIALPEMHIDILAMQDGVGTTRTSILEARQVFAAMQPVLERHEVEFWATNEAFDQVHGFPIDDEPFQAVPTTFSELRDRLDGTALYVGKEAVFEWITYMSPLGESDRARALYSGYQEYVDTEVWRLDISSYTYALPESTEFHPSASDASAEKLSDYVTGLLDGGPGSAFANGTFVGIVGSGTDPKPAVVLDLGRTERLDRVEVHYLVDAAAGIYGPQQIPGIADALTISVSDDGVSYEKKAWSNDFVDWQVDQAAAAFARRTISLNLSSCSGRFVKVDVRTANDMIFLSEIALYGTDEPAPAPVQTTSPSPAGMPVPGMLHLLLRQRVAP